MARAGRRARSSSASSSRPRTKRRQVGDAARGVGGDPGRPDGVVEVQGDADGAALRLRRASAGPSWQAVSLWLAEPFAALPQRTFPRPRFTVVAPSAEAAADVARRAALEEPLECAREGATLACAVSPERDRVRRAWMRSVPEAARFCAQALRASSDRDAVRAQRVVQ